MRSVALLIPDGDGCCKLNASFMIDDAQIAGCLLPLPQEFRSIRGECHLNFDSPVEFRAADPRVEQAVLAWRAAFRASPRESHQERPARIRVAMDRAKTPHREGYRLTIRPDGVELVGGSPAGCFRGLATLIQWFQAWTTGGGRAGENWGIDLTPTPNPQSENRNPQTAPIPCCTIVDWPDFHTRGLLYDITRGKVPTVDTLKILVDRLALLKVNQLQLYIEHAFVFSFDPEICRPADGLTPDEVSELDRYCADRFIDLVPALATFGHMGRILSMPRHRHLAEVEATRSWAAMTWPKRMRGLTLDCMNPQAHRLIESMWSDVLDAFSAPVVNLCGDEPWDLGQGKNREHFTAGGKGEAYVEHLVRTHEVCAARGRRTQFFSDVIRNYPRLLGYHGQTLPARARATDKLCLSVHPLPPESTVLHWGYDERADYEATARFVEAGFDTFVCPGTSGWKRIINAMGRAERNIAAFAAAGKKLGARGLLNTDWGDHGHFNLPACSWHGIALGAALAWRADHPTGDTFDAQFARLMFVRGDGARSYPLPEPRASARAESPAPERHKMDHLDIDKRSGVARLRAASQAGDACETWRLLWMPLREIAQDPTLPTLEQAATMGEQSNEAVRWLERYAHAGSHPDCDVEELTVACRFNRLLAEKLAFAHQFRTAPDEYGRVRSTRNAWAEQLRTAAQTYAHCWRSRNKPSGLQDVLNALASAAADIALK